MEETSIPEEFVRYVMVAAEQCGLLDYTEEEANRYYQALVARTQSNNLTSYFDSEEVPIQKANAWNVVCVYEFYVVDNEGFVICEIGERMRQVLGMFANKQEAFDYAAFWEEELNLLEEKLLNDTADWARLFVKRNLETDTAIMDVSNLFEANSLSLKKAPQLAF